MVTLIPSYQFEFLGGISNRGIAERTSQSIDFGNRHRFLYHLDDSSIAAAFGQLLPQAMADFIDIAIAVYVADRLSPRAPIGDLRPVDNCWHRRIRLVIPVRSPSAWSQQGVLMCFEELLDFLSDDEWTIQFVRRSHAPRPAECQSALFPRQSEAVSVLLSSDGLDSICGVGQLIRMAETDTVVPVTVVTNRRIATAVRTITQETRNGLSPRDPDLLPVQLKTRISSVGRSINDRESSQRTRGLIFLATGLASAAIVGNERLYVCENGIGAISLPMTSDHWGSRATKAMHPRTLKSVGDIASRVQDHSFTIENLGLFFSKGQLVSQLPARLMNAARQTSSCDHTVYLRPGQACGKCTSCLLRRVALNAAGLGNDIDGSRVSYATDWFDPSTSWSAQNALSLSAMRYQVETLRQSMYCEDEFQGLAREFPSMFDVVALAMSSGIPRREVERQLSQLYRVHIREFDAFVERIERSGWGRNASVVNLIAPSAPGIAG